MRPEQFPFTFSEKMHKPMYTKWVSIVKKMEAHIDLLTIEKDASIIGLERAVDEEEYGIITPGLPLTLVDSDYELDGSFALHCALRSIHMGNESSKQKTLNGKASRVAKGAGAAGGALVASPLVIIASPLYLGPQHFIEQNTTGLGIVPNAVAGLVAGALAAPFLPLVLPFMAAKQALNGASGQEKSSPVGDYIAASVAANEAFNTVPPRSVVSQGAIEEVREYFGMDCDNCYNIAIVGGSGQGK
ncbi:hypothetical protein BC938DRAFT_473990, partial [Jimgerdemannia flammicorona]